MNDNSSLPISQRSTFLRFGRWLCSWRGVRTLLLILIWPVTLVALYYGIENWRGSRAWNQCRQDLLAKGAVLDFHALIPKPIPDERNFAAIPLVKSWFQKESEDARSKRWNDNYYAAAQRVGQNRPKDKQRAVTDLVAWQMAFAAAASSDSNKDDTELSFPNSDATARAEAGKEILKQMEHFEPLFTELRQASTRPESLYPVVYDESNPWAILLPHLANIRAVGDRLILRASAELAAGQSDQAQDDVRLVFALADSLRQDPFLISYLVRLKVLSQGVQLVWEGLRLHLWTAPQLERFQELLSKYNLMEGIGPCMQTERAAALVTIDFLRNKGGFEMLGVGESGDPWPDLLGRIAPRGWFDFERVNYCKLHELTAATGWDARSMRVSPREVDAARDKLASALEPGPIKLFFEHKAIARLLLPALSKVIQRGAAGQTAFNQAVLACAIERFRLGKSGCPDDLGALSAAGLLTPAPQDVLNGEPMKYRKTGNQDYVLYSVGWDGKDDGGKPGKTQFDETGDWVW